MQCRRRIVIDQSTVTTTKKTIVGTLHLHVPVRIVNFVRIIANLERLKHSTLIQNVKGIEYGIFGEGSQISTNHRRESTVFSLLIGRNLRPFSDNTVSGIKRENKI